MMKIGAMAKRSASAVVPVAMLFVPKCPLCVLPLFAALGSALPPQPVLDAFVSLTAAAWLAYLARARPSVRAWIPGLLGALMLSGGRWLDLRPAAWTGALAMAAVAVLVRAKKLTRAASTCGPSVRCGAPALPAEATLGGEDP